MMARSRVISLPRRTSCPLPPLPPSTKDDTNGTDDAVSSSVPGGGIADGTDDAVALKEVAGVEILESEGEGDGEGWRECGGDHGTPGMRL